MLVARIYPSVRILGRSISHCLSVAKNYDRENYLCSLLLPEPQRTFAMALLSMNVELAQVRDRAIQLDQAGVRFAFWREVVDGLFTARPPYDTPIVRELHQAVQGLKLSKYLFLKLIEAREKHFNECTFNTLKDAERYAEDVHVSVLFLINEACGIKSVTVDHALSHLGRAQGLVNLLRGSVPLARRRRVVVLPLALLNKHNLNQEMVLRLLLADPIQSQSNSSLENLLDMYHDLASEAHRHACTSAQLARQAIVEAKANDRTHSRHYLVRQMLPIVPVANYLHRLRTWAHFDPRRIDSYIDGLLPVKLSWYAWCNKLPPEPKA